MLLTSVFQKFAFKIFTLILTAFLASNPVVIPDLPDSMRPLRAGEAKAVFAAVADPQISNYMLKRYPVFSAVCEDLKGASDYLDAVVAAGDIVENGLAIEYEAVYEGLSGIDSRFIFCTGNHDIRLRSFKQSSKRIAAFSNALNGEAADTPLKFAETVNGVKIIVLRSDKSEFEEAYFSDETLEALDSELAAANGEPVFVFCHQPLKNTHGLPDTWGSPIDSAGSVGAQSDELREILTSYDNVFFVTGHLHTGFGEYTCQTDGKLTMVNLPSLCIENKDGEYNGPGIGYIVEVYGDEVVFRARDFMLGKWLSQYDITVPVK